MIGWNFFKFLLDYQIATHIKDSPELIENGSVKPLKGCISIACGIIAGGDGVGAAEANPGVCTFVWKNGGKWTMDSLLST